MASTSFSLFRRMAAVYVCPAKRGRNDGFISCLGYVAVSQAFLGRSLRKRSTSETEVEVFNPISNKIISF